MLFDELFDFFVDKTRESDYSLLKYYGEENVTQFAIQSDCSAENGASKAVFAFYDINEFVFKVPFHGIDEDYEFYKAGFCAEESNMWDYCATEAWLYKKAIEENVEQFFAGTWYIGSVKDYPVYVSSRMILDYDDSVDKVSNSAVSLAAHYETELTSEYIQRFINDYGEKATERLLAFIEDYCIDDLHCGNFGMDKQGKLKIIDYSGYFD